MLKRIKGIIKHYDWGGYNFLPELLNLKKEDRPFAEYWLGTHPDGDATLAEENKSLGNYLQDKLPFLFKILDVRDMLSIQVHPDKSTAEHGFAREEVSGKPRNAFNRVFKDNNHKPELMVALSDFWLVQGFQSDENIVNTLDRNPELKPIQKYFLRHGLKDTYAHLMTMPQEEVNAILKPLGHRIKPLYEKNKLDKTDINFWSARAYFTFNKKGLCDRGIFSLYLMNLVKLNVGDGIFQAPGVLHAYLEGQNVECMAASDNVVRGGLTSKHIDAEQLLKIVKFEHEEPQIIRPNGKGIYETPATEFKLQKIEREGSYTIFRNSIVINIGQPATLLNGSDSLYLEKGEAALVETNMVLTITTQDSEMQLFIAL
ncbi:MAG: mannose-6-phosphate isomerase, class I [Saprospiraceae bacterium]|nr:mannose-6-phosphate isomerase, class I [Saprospiraceae bacterium]